MEQKILSAEPRRTFSNEFKLQMVKLASQPGASVARIAREHDINDNLLLKWLWLIGLPHFLREVIMKIND